MSAGPYLIIALAYCWASGVIVGTFLANEPGYDRKSAFISAAFGWALIPFMTGTFVYYLGATSIRVLYRAYRRRRPLPDPAMEQEDL